MAPGYKQPIKPKPVIVKEPFKKRAWCKHDTDDTLADCPDDDSLYIKPHKGR